MPERVRPEDLEVRRAVLDDDIEVTPLLRAALGKSDDPHYESFLHWKHRENAFGPSPAWVALHEGRVVGYRTFLRWAFLDGTGREISAVRAVDTATHPEYQGLGIFRLLTLRAVADLTVTGTGFVFNTPNDKSRPGYLKMGWSPAGRLPVGVVPSGPRGLVTMTSSRVPAELWSAPTTTGFPAGEVMRDDGVVEALLQHAPTSGVRTARSPAYLRWRTGFGPLGYRVLFASATDPGEGGMVFRVRRRGAGLEAAVVELLAPDARTGLRLVRSMLRATGADYAIGLRTRLQDPWIPVPQQGPLLTTRPLAAAPPAAREWRLTLGDVELF